MADGRIEVVLFDADGVIQWPTPGFVEAFARIGGEEPPPPDQVLGGREVSGFMLRAFEAERGALDGSMTLREALWPVIADNGGDDAYAQLLAVWHAIDVDPEVVEVVREVRSAGVLTAVGTNQTAARAPIMRGDLGYDELFERHFYSYEVGFAKPDVRFFESVLADLGVPAERVLFIDDHPDNVASAASLGIVAEHHDHATGAAGVRAILESVGVL